MKWLSLSDSLLASWYQSCHAPVSLVCSVTNPNFNVSFDFYCTSTVSISLTNCEWCNLSPQVCFCFFFSNKTTFLTAEWTDCIRMWLRWCDHSSECVLFQMFCIQIDFPAFTPSDAQTQFILDSECIWSSWLLFFVLMAAESQTATETRQFLSSNETRLNKDLSSVQHPSTPIHCSSEERPLLSAPVTI